jgi:uncharacterized membrane protein
MKKALNKVGSLITFLFLLLAGISLVASASDFGPRRPEHTGSTRAVVEPAAIALLGAGLVSLAIYANKKRNKKQ